SSLSRNHLVYLTNGTREDRELGGYGAGLPRVQSSVRSLGYGEDAPLDAASLAVIGTRRQAAYGAIHESIRCSTSRKRSESALNIPIATRGWSRRKDSNAAGEMCSALTGSPARAVASRVSEISKAISPKNSPA